MKSKGPEGDLTVTALYTSQVWRWGGLAGAELFDTPIARTVYRITNLFLFLVRLFRWRMRSLKHSLLHRHTFLDAVLRGAGARRVLELAAGLSRRGVAFSQDAAVAYTEVDLPSVVAAKRALLDRSEVGRAVAARRNWRLVAADVTALDDAALDALAPSAPGAELFVVAEGLFMYLEAEGQRALWARLAGLLQRAGGGRLLFDLVPAVEQPPPGLLGRALGWLMGRFTGGRGFARDERGREQILAELRAAGFTEVEAVEPCLVAERYGLPYPRKPTQQLVFLAAP